jgi:tetratricopeptide (TPR) repeat protein
MKFHGVLMLLLAYCYLSAGILYAQDAQTNFARAEDTFLRNKPQEAIPLLESVLAADPANIKAAMYLGIAYQQMKRWDDAIALYKKLLTRAGVDTAQVAYNLGNVYFARGSAAFAEEYYSLAIQKNESYSSAYLNRANARIKVGNLADAVKDYTTYLSLEPASPKRPQIEQLLALIQSQFAAEEQKKLEAEAAAKAEEERRRRLLEEVSASLQAASEETKGLQAASEQVQSYDGEFVLE